MKYSVRVNFVLLALGFSFLRPSLAEEAGTATDTGTTTDHVESAAPAITGTKAMPAAARANPSSRKRGNSGNWTRFRQPSYPPGYRPMPGRYPLPAPGRTPLTPAEIDKLVRSLPREFDERFRAEYRKALEAETPPLEPTASESQLTVGDNPSGSGESIDGGDSADSSERGSSDSQAETVREKLQDRFALEIPGANTRIIFIERPSGQTPNPPSAASDKKAEDSKKNEAREAKPNNANPTLGSGTTTIIRAKPTATDNWEVRQPAKAIDTARAERGFRALDTYLTSPAAATATAKGAAPKPEGRKEKQEQAWSEQVVYFDRASPNLQKMDAATWNTTSREGSVYEASVDRDDLSLETIARNGFRSLRQRASDTPLAGILVNLGLMLAGTLLLFLMMGKRRRLATVGFPPAARRVAQEIIPAPADRDAYLPMVVANQSTPFQGREFDETTGSFSQLTPNSGMNDDIRVAFDPHIRRWVLKRRELGGRLSAPLAELQAGTVVRGTALGASSAQMRYRLSPTNTWIATDEEEQIIIAVKAQSFRSASR